jgi:hypothetical protein
MRESFDANAAVLRRESLERLFEADVRVLPGEDAAELRAERSIGVVRSHGVTYRKR